MGFSVCLVAALVAPVPNSGPRPPGLLLVSFDNLQAGLDSPDLRLLDARSRSAFDAGHIPGAVWVNAKTAEQLAARPGGLADRAAWESWIKPLGIGPETKVVVYDANRQLDAARVWWLLSYLGVERVGLVDGGFPLWSREKRPTTVEARKVEPKAFRVAFRNDRSATRDDVLKAVRNPGTARVVDARGAAEHSGVEKRSKRGGHVPTACHLEWSGLVDKDGRFLDEPALRSRLGALGIAAGETVITHCQGGGRASVDAFVFERLGFPVRNYYPGWSDWGNREETHVETGPAKHD